MFNERQNNILHAELKAQGWGCKPCKGGWIHLPADESQSGITQHKTDSDHRSQANFIQRLRRAGYRSPFQLEREKVKAKRASQGMERTEQTTEVTTMGSDNGRSDKLGDAKRQRPAFKRELRDVWADLGNRRKIKKVSRTKDLARMFGVHSSTLYNWRTHYGFEFADKDIDVELIKAWLLQYDDSLADEVPVVSGPARGSIAQAASRIGASSRATAEHSAPGLTVQTVSMCKLRISANEVRDVLRKHYGMPSGTAIHATTAGGFEATWAQGA